MAATSHSSHGSNAHSSNVVGVHYRVGKKIGEGSFGVIFEGQNLLNNQQVAIKFVLGPNLSRSSLIGFRSLEKVMHLNYGMNIGRIKYWLGVVCYLLQRVLMTVGIPNVYYFGQEGLHNILVIDLLGPSLEDLFDYCQRRFSQKTVCMVAKQMVSAS